MSQRKKNIFNSKRKNSDESTNVIYINMPISSIEEDKIGIAQYVDDLKSAIDKGVQSIAVTSDFGGGKSSLIRYLESSYKYRLKKFCYVNLWSEFNQKGTRNLHKSFIYQFASQINIRKGNYVSKRLSENYGIFTIALPTIWAKVLSFVTFFFLIIGLLCTTLYDVVSNVLTFKLFTENHDKIGSAAFCFAVFFALLFLYNSDIVFSAKKATDEREVDEHELMDIYQYYIGRPHLRHYIVVIEDLDRSNNDDVIQFIREFRRYYIPYRKQRRFKIFPNKNRITFIVNIKSEKQIMKQGENNLYAKAFDYVLDLKEIHIDNYDVILKKLLDENRGLFDESHIPVFNDKGEIKPEFEWLITGKKIDIREIKMRLNTTISTYINLCTKFDRQFISLEKCIAAS